MSTCPRCGLETMLPGSHLCGDRMAEDRPAAPTEPPADASWLSFEHVQQATKEEQAARELTQLSQELGLPDEPMPTVTAKNDLVRDIYNICQRYLTLDAEKYSSAYLKGAHDVVWAISAVTGWH